jgi:rod shape-determining protein MreC
MSEFLKSVRFKILAAVLAVMAGFMVMSIYTGGTASFFSQLLSLVTMPVQRFSADVAEDATSFLDRFLNASKTYEQNAILREQLNNAYERLVDYDKIKHENEQFREIIGMKEKRGDIIFETASVIARDPASRFYGFTIDKGSLDGLAQHDPVMTADGLVGYIEEVSLTSSKVKTVLDVTINVGAYSSATRDIGVVTGTVELAAAGLCHVEYLPRNSEIEVGDIILTSGGTEYPKDIIIGTVEEVKTGSHGISMVAVLRPTAQVGTVKDVFVITSFEGQGGIAGLEQGGTP